MGAALRVLVATLMMTALWQAASPALAATVRIDTGGDPEARLELRTVVLPGGEERDLYVVTAERVVVTSDELTVIAQRLEFDPAAGVVRIVGRGRVERPDEVLVGDDLVVELDGGRLDGDDVLVITDRVDVRGARAQRVEGRIRLLSGRFSPCGRCGQEVEDYAFVAERIEILPGDRLIAWDVVVLVRDAPLLPLPLLVLPLAEPSRIPRLAIRTGDGEERAEVRLDWPYVSGPNAFGTFRARLLLDVVPDQGGVVDGGLFGGRPERAYLAGGIDHSFYDDRGAGAIDVAYEPAFAARGDEPATEPTLRFEARYATDPPAGDPQVSLRLARDDEARPRLVEAEASVAATSHGVRAEASSRMAVPLGRDVDSDPSWDGPREPRTVPARLLLDAEPGLPLRAGALRLEAFALDTGAFEDAPDPTNRSAAGAPRLTAGRVELRHRLALDPLSVAGVELSGRMDFQGRYYDTEERQVDWDSELRARRAFGDVGALELRLRRDAAEGETPFSFDRIPLRTRSDLTASLSLGPWSGFRLTGEAGYLLEDDRRPDEIGLLPTRLRLEAFADVRAFDLALQHDAEPRRGDVGTLTLDVAARAPSGRWRAELDATGVRDLDRTLPESDLAASARDTSRAEASAALGLRDVLVVSARTAVETEPRDDETGRWDPLELTATAGTLQAGDGRPGLEAFWTRDLNDGTTREAGYEAAVDVAPFRFEAEQRFGPAGGSPGTHRLAVVWTDVVRATLRGVELLPAGALGLEPDPAAATRMSLRVEDDGGDPGVRFSAEWSWRRTPIDGGVERRGSVFEARARIAERRFANGLVRLALDGFLDVPLRDDALATTYLRRANVELGLDVGGRVGLQGTVGYRGSYDGGAEEVRSGRLAFEEVSLVVRASRELYLGATLDDVWEIVDEARGDLAFDPRPTLFATWDRCCWAMYASWDTRSGEVVITIGAPGRAEGPQLAFEEGPVVPWNDEDGP
jgi:hypothetical protein